VDGSVLPYEDAISKHHYLTGPRRRAKWFSRPRHFPLLDVPRKAGRFAVLARLRDDKDTYLDGADVQSCLPGRPVAAGCFCVGDGLRPCKRSADPD